MTLAQTVPRALLCAALVWACWLAYDIRLVSIREYGTILRSHDPYFQYRATEYLYWNGWKRFSQWFDYESWYPLGRPIGTTTYPGLQFVAVWSKRYLAPSMSLNDVCCYVPVWFGILMTVATGLIAYECTLSENTSDYLYSYVMKKWNKEPHTLAKIPPKDASSALECGVVAANIVAILPNTVLFTMSGNFDNESVAVPIMLFTFYFWIRALRPSNGLASSSFFGVCTAVSYFGMVASWGGYIFALNMIGLHAGLLLALGRYTRKLYASYCLFYLLGTIMAMQLPVVGSKPIRSMEQIFPGAVFYVFHVFMVTDMAVRFHRQGHLDQKGEGRLRRQIAAAAVATAAIVTAALHWQGFFGPLSARVFFILLPGAASNPIIDSVAEHLLSPDDPKQILQHVYTLAPFGFLALARWYFSDASSLVLLWAIVVRVLAPRMSRLDVLLGPVGCVLSSVVVGPLLSWCIRQWWDRPYGESTSGSANSVVEMAPGVDRTALERRRSKYDENTAVQKKDGNMTVRAVAVVLVSVIMSSYVELKRQGRFMSRSIGYPRLVEKPLWNTNPESTLTLDHREIFFWLRNNTPRDARIMASWSDGYHIAVISNRTTLADGNTWNHEHIAFLDLILTSPVEEGWEIARHLADYLLVDVKGSAMRMARVANSVYPGLCPDPTCIAYISGLGEPSATLRQTLFYNLKHGVDLPTNLFEPVYTPKYKSKHVYRIVGVSEESKQFVLNNRVCDVNGSWYCPGQYPPALRPLLDTKMDFNQPGDFNRKSSDTTYHARYIEGLKGIEHAAKEYAADAPNREAVLMKQMEDLTTRLKTELEIIKNSKRHVDGEETHMDEGLASSVPLHPAALDAFD